jgi:hypothetical protein
VPWIRTENQEGEGNMPLGAGTGTRVVDMDTAGTQDKLLLDQKDWRGWEGEREGKTGYCLLLGLVQLLNRKGEDQGERSRRGLEEGVDGLFLASCLLRMGNQEGDNNLQGVDRGSPLVHLEGQGTLDQEEGKGDSRHWCLYLYQVGEVGRRPEQDQGKDQDKGPGSSSGPGLGLWLWPGQWMACLLGRVNFVEYASWILSLWNEKNVTRTWGSLGRLYCWWWGGRCNTNTHAQSRV